MLNDQTLGSAGALSRAGCVQDFEEGFADPQLNADRWEASYLPQWTTPDRSGARYQLEPGLCRLRIDADQPAWRPEDGQMRVSNLQTGTFSGPLGSALGQHRHRPDLTVVTPTPARRLYTPTYGVFEAELRASPDPSCMLAFWLIGFEEASPEQSGEICVAELFGHAITPDGATVNIGVKAHHDPTLHDDMAEISLDLDATAWHTYTVDWTPEAVRFYVDDSHVRTVHQHLGYPMQLMVDLFEFPAAAERDPADYPKTGEVKAVRGHRRP